MRAESRYGSCTPDTRVIRLNDVRPLDDERIAQVPTTTTDYYGISAEWHNVPAAQ